MRNAVERLTSLNRFAARYVLYVRSSVWLSGFSAVAPVRLIVPQCPMVSLSSPARALVLPAPYPLPRVPGMLYVRRVIPWDESQPACLLIMEAANG